jgi:hypothetical protein
LTNKACFLCRDADKAVFGVFPHARTMASETRLFSHQNDARRNHPTLAVTTAITDSSSTIVTN